MTKLPQSNIYSASADEIRELFDDYLDGAESGVVLALSERPLDSKARNAIEKSLDSFGYGSDACLYATLFPIGDEAEGSDIPLDAQALFMLVESIDPLCVICADEASVNRIGQAYRADYALDVPARAFGRPAVMFRDFPSMLASEEKRQRAWKLLKSLPRR